MGPNWNVEKRSLLWGRDAGARQRGQGGVNEAMKEGRTFQEEEATCAEAPGAEANTVNYQRPRQVGGMMESKARVR